MGKDILFGICADAHQSMQNDVSDRIHTFVEEATKRKADFIIQLGDFVLPDASGEKALAEWNKFAGPRYHVLGNHDTAAAREKEYGRLDYVVPYKDPLYAFVRLKENGLIQIIGKQSEYVGSSPMELHWEHYASPQISYREVWMNGFGEL